MRAGAARFALIACCTQAACRVYFDPVEASGHDEDGDGVADAIDTCPHVFDPQQTDSDGDGVGDACDPEPANPRQSLALFDPLLPGDTPFQFNAEPNGTWTEQPDARHFDGKGTGVIIVKTPIANADIWLGLDVVRSTGAPRQLAVDLIDPGVRPYYYADVYDAGNNPTAGVSHYDGSNFMSLQNAKLANGIHAGTLTYHVTVRASSAQLTTDIGWPGEPYTISAGTPGAKPTSQFVFTTQQLEFSIRYIAVIATN
jgi:thrombospondin type 3 repeat protein